MAKIWQKYNLAYYEKHPTPPGSFIVRSGPDNPPAPDEDVNAQKPAEQNAGEQGLPGLNGATTTGEPTENLPTAGSNNIGPASLQSESPKSAFPLPSALEQLTGSKTNSQPSSQVDQAIPLAPTIRPDRHLNTPPPLAPMRPVPVMTTPPVSQFRPAPPQQSKFLPPAMPAPAMPPASSSGSSGTATQ